MPENPNGAPPNPKTTDAYFPNAPRVTADALATANTTTSAPLPRTAPDGSRPSGASPDPPANAARGITRLNRADILRNALQTRKRKVIDMPEWGGEVIVMEMTRRQREAVEGQEATRNLDGTLLIRVPQERLRQYIPCILDLNGDQLFSVEDADTLSEMGNTPINRIISAIDALTTEDGGAEDADREAMRDPT